MSEKKPKKWIKQAIKHPGALTEAAKREGVSNSAYEEEHEHDSGKAGERSRLAMSLKHMSHAHKTKSASNKKIRQSMYGEKEKE